jgi:hypothetical protein
LGTVYDLVVTKYIVDRWRGTTNQIVSRDPSYSGFGRIYIRPSGDIKMSVRSELFKRGSGREDNNIAPNRLYCTDVTENKLKISLVTSFCPSLFDSGVFVDTMCQPS